MLKDLIADYARHGSSLRSPGLWLVANYHFGRWAQRLSGPARKVASAAYGVLLAASELVLGSTLHRETRIGEGFHVAHADGIRIDPAAVIGRRAGIMQGVAIDSSIDRVGAPIIGDDVFIGAGAKILGPVRAGDRARIGANSLVVGDVARRSPMLHPSAEKVRKQLLVTCLSESLAQVAAQRREAVHQRHDAHASAHRLAQLFEAL